MTAKTSDREGGSATLWVLVLAVLLTGVGSTAIVVASGLAAHRKAAAAADLAALAGATRSVSDGQAACRVADVVAEFNGAQLLECSLSRSSLLVVVGIDPRPPWLPTLRVAARAGYP